MWIKVKNISNLKVIIGWEPQPNGKVGAPPACQAHGA
jgi:hypothetical protein